MGEQFWIPHTLVEVRQRDIKHIILIDIFLPVSLLSVLTISRQVSVKGTGGSRQSAHINKSRTITFHTKYICTHKTKNDQNRIGIVAVFLFVQTLCTCIKIRTKIFGV